ncbi:MAG: FliM/FliN family flagellar motor C-terminal domain-containing protein [Acidobacteriaceae bacterium]
MEALQETSASESDRAAGGSFAHGNSPKPETAQMSPSIPQRNAWPAIEWVPIQLGVALPVLRFCVRDLLALNPGQIIATAWSSGDDLPLSIEDVQLAWVEMEAVDQEMAIRITRLL